MLSIKINIKKYNNNILYIKLNELFFEKQVITKHFKDLKQIKIKYFNNRNANIISLKYLNLI